VEFLSSETVAAAPPQQVETLRAELFKQRRKLKSDSRIKQTEAQLEENSLESSDIRLDLRNIGCRWAGSVALLCVAECVKF
jgi:hypothetical protein